MFLKLVDFMHPHNSHMLTKTTDYVVVLGYGKEYSDDKHFGKTAYTVMSAPEQIQAEIINHGPVEAAFTVYSDFPSYKSGKVSCLC